jgi:hypothetical protein
VTLAEKCYIVGAFGDIKQPARIRLLTFAEVPETGVLIGGHLTGKFQDGRLSVRIKPSLLDS